MYEGLVSLNILTRNTCFVQKAALVCGQPKGLLVVKTGFSSGSLVLGVNGPTYLSRAVLDSSRV